MIAEGAITKLTTKYQTTALNVRREYVQHLFLSYFYQQPQSKDIFFKGGTALRIVHQSPRFSEDLDFGSTLHDITEIDEAVLHTVESVEREGIKTHIAESKKTSGGYLAIIELKLGSDTVLIRIEASFREKALEGESETIANEFVPPYLITSLAQKQLVEGKIAALLDRQKPRDFYDLYFMLQKGLVAVEQRSVLKEVLPLIQGTKIDFSQELRQFLPQSHWPIIKDFKTTLERSILRFAS